MIKIASIDPQTVVGGAGSAALSMMVGLSLQEIPAMAGMVGIKVASTVLEGWKAELVKSANDDFRAAVAKAPGVKAWTAFGADLSRHSSVQYEYSDEVKKLDAKLKAMKAKEREKGTATVIPSSSEPQEFCISLPTPYDLSNLVMAG